MFDEKWLEIDAQDFISELDVLGSKCMLKILPTDIHVNILGVPLYMNYYTVHRDNESTLGFAPLVDSPKSQITVAEALPRTQFIEEI